jgi:[acyl-carrier-protein] S-malonyltransferase
MAAVLGIDSELVKDVCAEASQQHLVVAANFNTPIQTVISGTKEGVEIASNLAKEKGAKRVMPLAVGGPFHSPLIEKASFWLQEEMAKLEFKGAKIPIVANVNALPETNPQKIVENLVNQVTSPVLWVDSVKYMASQGVDIFIEFGPQKVLSGMITKIIENITVLNVDKIGDIPLVKQKLEELL